MKLFSLEACRFYFNKMSSILDFSGKLLTISIYQFKLPIAVLLSQKFKTAEMQAGTVL